MEEELRKLFVKNNIMPNRAFSFPKGEYLDKIHSLFINNVVYEPITLVDYVYLAVYYGNILKDYDKMKIYYLKLIESNDTIAMVQLASYYENIEKNYKEMKKYYLMAIKNNSSKSMNNLGYRYKMRGKYIKAIKYYQLAIANGSNVAMCNLGYYYEDTEKNYIEMKKYYLMAIERGNMQAMNNLSSYYSGKNKLGKALYYLSMTSNIDNILGILRKIILIDEDIDEYFYKSIPHLNKIESKLPKIIRVIIKLYEKEIDILENSIKYAPDQEGYKLALQDYHSLISS